MAPERIGHDCEAPALEAHLVAELALRFRPARAEGQGREIANPQEEIVAEQIVEREGPRGSDVSIADRFEFPEERIPFIVGAIAVIHVHRVVRDQRRGPGRRREAGDSARPDAASYRRGRAGEIRHHSGR